MKCKKCSKELSADAKFCDNCGTAVEYNDTQENASGADNTDVNTGVIATSKRKSVFRRWWFWLIVVVVIISVIYGIFFDKEDEVSGVTNKNNTAVTEVMAETQAETTETISAVDIEKEFKESCTEIDFATLARNPDKYKGNNYVFEGKVIQVSEGQGELVTLRINITKNEYEYLDSALWTDTILATILIPQGEDKILEDDIITFWGICDGECTYESVFGANITVPKISIQYYELINE